MIWMIIAAIFLLLVLFVPKFGKSLKKVKNILVFVAIIILILSALIWIKQGNADFTSSKTIFISTVNYFSWMKSTGMATFDLGKNKVQDINNFFSKNDSLYNKSDGRR